GKTTRGQEGFNTEVLSAVRESSHKYQGRWSIGKHGEGGYLTDSGNERAPTPLCTLAWLKPVPLTSGRRARPRGALLLRAQPARPGAPRERGGEGDHEEEEDENEEEEAEEGGEGG
ncbi:unnamed protein product, partial [Boreogadus saida]